MLLPPCSNPSNPPDPYGDDSMTAASAGAASAIHQNSAAVVLGTTPQEIHARFASIIEGNFSHGAAEQLTNRLSDHELARLATFYSSASKQGSAPLLNIMAARLSDKSLLRVAAAFGVESVHAAVTAHASPAVKAAFEAQMGSVNSFSAAAVSLPTNPVAMSGPAPNLDMTLQEIYLDFRTAPTGSLSPASALSETMSFAGKNLAMAATAGWAVGTVINGVINEYDPSLVDAIGGTIATTMDSISTAASDIKAGQYMSAMDQMFGWPVTQSGDWSGDFDVTQDMGQFYTYGGGC